MADTKKHSLLVVILILAIFGVATTSGFTQELKSISSEIARRSSGVLEYLEKDDTLLTRFFQPVFTIITFFVSLFSMFTMVQGWFGLGALPQLAYVPTELKSGERDQRLLENLEDRIKSSLETAINEYENEVKKKKK